MRRLAVLGAAFATVVAVAAMLATTATGGPKKTINIAVFLASSANTYWAAELQGAQDAAKKYGNVKLTVFDGQFNTAKQVNQLRDALIKKTYDAWFVGPNDGGPLTPTLRSAIKQGVKVGCALVPCGPDIRNTKVQIPGQVVFDGLGFYPNGQLLGQLVEQGCKGDKDCKVFWMPGLPTLPLEKARTDGLNSVIGDLRSYMYELSGQHAATMARETFRLRLQALLPGPDGLEWDISIPDDLVLDESTERHLYLLVKELVSNIARHARALGIVELCRRVLPPGRDSGDLGTSGHPAVTRDDHLASRGCPLQRVQTA